MLTTKQAFKIGFLRHCADAGLTAEETLHVVKQATAAIKSAAATDAASLNPIAALLGLGSSGLNAAGSAIGSGIGSVASGLTNAGIGGAVLGPAVLGAGAGAGLSALTDIDDTDINAVKKRELIDEYYRQIDLMRSRRRGAYKSLKQ